MISRRTFVNGLAAGVAGSAIASTAKSYAQILGANDRVNFAINGLNGRGHAHLSALQQQQDARIAYICDVDSTIRDKFAGERAAVARLRAQGRSRTSATRWLQKMWTPSPSPRPTTGTAPMAVLGLKAGKHVYVEKPSSQNCREGELIVAAQKKYGKLVQVGDQQRSSAYTIKMIAADSRRLHRQDLSGPRLVRQHPRPMGIGKAAPVPATLDWDLWQGPAPRSEYKDNIHPYNWHWLRRYGTGETLNNGTHEVDVCPLGPAASRSPTPSPPPAAAINSRMTGSSTTPSSPTSATPTRPSPGRAAAARACRSTAATAARPSSAPRAQSSSTATATTSSTGKASRSTSIAVGNQTSPPISWRRTPMTDAHFANFIAAIRGRRAAALAHPGSQRHRHHAAALEHRVVRQPQAPSRHRDRAHSQRPRSHEVLGPQIRARLGSHRLTSGFNSKFKNEPGGPTLGSFLDSRVGKITNLHEYRVPQVRGPRGQVLVRGVEISILRPGIARTSTIRCEFHHNRSVPHPFDFFLSKGWRVLLQTASFSETRHAR